MLFQLLLVVLSWLWRRLPVYFHQRSLSVSGFEIIDPSLKVDEERLPHYKPSRFYPVYLGSILNSRYRVLSKLGYGSYSTVWLSRDITEQKYVALKVCISNSRSIERECAAYAHLREVLRTSTASLESSLVRISLEEFDISGLGGEHRCFAFEALTIDLVATRDSIHFDEAVFKSVAFHVFRALEFLHTKAQMVHCDLRPENFFLTALDQSTFRNLETCESIHPSARKTYSDRTIYRGIGQVIPEAQLLGVPILCDFGEARFGKECYDESIQPFMYQAPEVVFMIPWSYPVDIWNAGVMLWELFERTTLLSGAYEGQPSYPQLVAEMIALMGTPPVPFLLHSPSEVRQSWVNDTGEWCCEHQEINLPCLTLEGEEKLLKDTGANNAHFLQFMKRILVWEPEKRATASELLADPWLASVTSSSTLLSS